MPISNAIFISYRRSDSNDVTGRIYDRLAAHFGRNIVFKDVDSIPPGVDFRTHLQQGVGRCQVLVAVIGQTWLSVADAAGLRRLDDPNDWVRAEIETALSRDIPVIPLLVGGARPPGVDELPASLRDLAYRNCAQALRSHPLEESLRQKNDRLKAAVNAIAKGDLISGFHHLNQTNSIRGVQNQEQRVQTIVQDYLALLLSQRQKTLIIANTNAEGRSMTQAIRQGLQAEGRLAGDTFTLTSLKTRDLTIAQAKYAQNYEPGDILIPTQDYRKQQLAKGQQYQVSGDDRPHHKSAGD